MFQGVGAGEGTRSLNSVGGKHSFFDKMLENTEFLAWKATFVQLSKNGYDDSSKSLPPLS